MTDVRFVAEAPGAGPGDRAWVDDSLAALEAEMFPLVKTIMEVLP